MHRQLFTRNGLVSALVGLGGLSYSTALFGQAEKVQKKDTMRMVSYNLLSSHLADPGYFVHCDPAALDKQTRLNRIEAKINQEIEKGSIIALQEISHMWAGPLYTLFANKGYHMVTGLYGSQFSNYMGVGMAYDTDRYETIETDIVRVSDTTKKWQKRTPKPHPLYEWLVTPWKYFFPVKAPFDPWEAAKNRKNQLVTVRLRDRVTGHTFCVSTYHMPCLFGTPDKRKTMNLHAALIAQKLQDFCKGDPYILLGDFNIQPGSSSYKLLTEGVLDPLDEDYPDPSKGIDVNKVEKLNSAYVLANGTEPEFTNHAQTKYGPLFTETLDFIFCSKEWDVLSADPTPTREGLGGPFPDAKEPSDHIMIGAELSLAGKGE